MKPQSTFVAGVCAILSLIAVGSFRTTLMASVAPDNTVKVYTGTNYSGTELIFAPGQQARITLRAAYRHEISSLIVPPGYEVSLIDTDNGHQTQTYGAGNYASISTAMNNKADAVVISAP